MYIIKFSSHLEINKEVAFDNFTKAINYAIELNRFTTVKNLTISKNNVEIVAYKSVK